MLLLKPKDMATHLNTPPDKISILAKDIETANIYSFEKTALGSFLFKEKDIEILKEYRDLTYFFQKKKEALAMLDQYIKSKPLEKETKPSWANLLFNAKFV